MKPKTKDEMHLKRKFREEEEIPYEIERDVRVNKRIWKRKLQKLHRQQGRRMIEQGFDDET